ncbi:MAG: tetraacyldisaccharide 4'-kinase, partial [Bacteroidales bacterium]|nr:tetraacyldisaccharide 4'-kinase [Bacteroidales bacterium]
AGSQRADVVIVSKCPTTISEAEKKKFYKKLNITNKQRLFFSAFTYGEVAPVFSSMETKDLKGMEVLLLTGIANPKPLKAYLEEQGARVTSLSFSDHYQFTTKDMAQVVTRFETLNSQNRGVVTTEKDSVRLKSGMEIPKLIRRNLFYIPIRVEILENELQLHQIIETYVAKN